MIVLRKERSYFRKPRMVTVFPAYVLDFLLYDE